MVKKLIELPSRRSEEPGEGEREVLLPNEDYRLVRHRKRHRGRLWLFPAVLILLTICCFKYLHFSFFGDCWGREARNMTISLDYTDELKFKQEGRGNIHGTLDIFETKGDEKPKLEVDVFTLTYDNYGADSVHLESAGNEVILRYDGPGLLPIKVSGRLHLSLDTLKELSVSTLALDMTMDIPNADLTKADLSSASGAFKSVNYFKSRDITVHLLSGKISGLFNLYDNLRLSTESGGIKVQVTPKEGTATAVTDVRTTSGGIEVEFQEAVEGRKYDSSVASTSGDISGTWLLGDSFSAKETSGQIEIELIGTDAKKSLVKTESISGNTRLRIGEQSVGVIQGSHTAVSGGTKVSYPSSWEGEIHAKVVSGNIKLRGKEVKIIKSKGSVGKEVWGEKGDSSKASLALQSVSGDIEIVVGK